MTTAERHRSDVSIAGVPWPAYKLVALAVGVLVLLAVGVVTADPAAAVLAAAGAATVVWLVAGARHPRGR